MTNTLKRKLIGVTATVWIFALTLPVFAAESIFSKATSGLKGAIDNAYGGGNEVTVSQSTFLDTLLFVLSTILTFIGVAFFVLLLYAGYLWMTARGNDEMLNKAKKITREAIIGLLIILLARIITEFTLTSLGEVIQNTTPTEQ